jgi:sugar phosphate isomerase/epimerase
MKLRVGVFLDNMGLELGAAMDAAAAMGADGFQIYVTAGAMLAENMTPAARQDFRKAYESRGLVLSATCADFGVSLARTEAGAVIPKLKAAVEQAVDLGTRIVTTHIGTIPANMDAKVCDPMRRAIFEVATYAAKHGVTFATETGPESGATLAAMLASVGSAGIGANFDPANLVMSGFDHLQSARDLARYIVHAHAKDSRKGQGELPLGAGDVNFPVYLAELNKLGVDVFHAIEREVGDNPLRDIGEALTFLRSL